jgi:hypothetical protein
MLWTQRGSLRSVMHPVDKGHRFLRRSATTGVVCCLGAGLEAHDRFFEARRGEMRLATVTERGNVRHLWGERRITPVRDASRHTVGMGVYIHSENMAHSPELSWM